MTRVVHTGDTHLGYQQYHRPERREDFLDGFRQVIEDAIEDDVDAVVHAGDLFHDRTPRLSDIMGALSVLETLADADIPFLAVVGNHESKRDQQWLDLFETLGVATRLGADPVEIGSVAFYGLDFVPRSQRDTLAYTFTDHDAEYATLVSHGLFEPFEHGDWDAREILREADVTFDAMLLGDDHTPETKHLTEPHAAWLTYCGSTERASASERKDRGYNLVEFGDAVDIRRRGIDTREFVFVDVQLGDGEGTQRVRERISEYDIADAVVIVTITGEGTDVMPAAIEEFAEERGALVTRVNDQRELTDESDIDVNFADPDDAVHERIQDLGLSPAAREIDETIRASKVADSNVAETVERRVTEIIEDQSMTDGASTETQTDGASTETQTDGESTETQTDGASTETQTDGASTDSQVTMGDYQ